MKEEKGGNSMEKIQTTLLARQFIKKGVKEGGFVIDATIGRGFDTE